VLSQVTVTPKQATLTSVTVVNPDGKQVDGAFDDSHSTWHTTGDLGYGKKYTVTATGTNSGGQPLQQTASFTTFKPPNKTMPYLQANALRLMQDGGTYGVGQPAIVHFDEPIKDKAAAQRLLSITTSPHVDGSWSWVTSQDVEWRPPQYWKSGTTVTVTAKVYGKEVSPGLWGQGDASATFHIGESHVSIADANNHQMQVFVNGQLVRTMPVSLGMGGTTTGSKGEVVDYWTHSGPHVVIGKAPVTHMSSATYGITDKKSKFYYDEDVRETVQITYGGEYAHLADWNILQQGHINTSHGCINIGPANAVWFYNLSQTGDVIDVRNTPRQLKATDSPGGWGMSWAQWTAGSAL